MLNFRYHIVSLVAVFLALGVGVIMGSAVIDSATIDVLEDQSAQLQTRLQQAESRIAELEAVLSRLNEEQQLLAEQGSEVLLDEQLDGVPIVIVTAQGADAEAFDRLRDLLARADAALLGSIRVRDRLDVREEAERRDLAAVMARSAGLSADVLRREALELVARSAAGGVPGASVPEPIEGPSLADLAEAGFVDVEPPEGGAVTAIAAPPPATHVVVLWSEGAEVSTDGVGLPLVRALAAQPATPVVVAEPTPAEATDPDAEPAGTLVRAVRAEEALASTVSTVDNLDTFPGRLAAVLAVELEGRNAHGHFGTADGAQRLLPASPESPVGG